MLTGHEKPLTEYSNPFLMFCRKYDLSKSFVFLTVDMVHPGKKKDNPAETVDAARRCIKLLAKNNPNVLHDFDLIMEQLYKAHNIKYIKVADNGED